MQTALALTYNFNSRHGSAGIPAGVFVLPDTEPHRKNPP